MLDAVLLGLPPVTTFLSTVLATLVKPVVAAEAESGKNRLFGDSFASIGRKAGVAKRSKGCYVVSAAIKLAEEFDGMCKEYNIEFKGLDEWVESLAMFVVAPVAMSRDVDVQTCIMEKHKQLCGTKYIHSAEIKTFVHVSIYPCVVQLYMHI